MTPGPKNSANDRMHQVKIDIHDDIRQRIKPCDLEAEEIVTHSNRRVYEEPGQVEMDVSSVYETALMARPAAGPLMVIDLK